MENLLNETLNTLEDNGLTPNDVLWVGFRDGTRTGTWSDFAKIANIEYDDGYGSNEIDSRLVIVGKDWWLSRREYDGSEWWSFNRKPEENPEAEILNNVLEV